MNKKIILPFAVATLGVTACNGGKFDPVAASKLAFEHAVATAKDLTDFEISTNVSCSKFDASYTHEIPDQKAGRPKSESYDFKLTDLSGNLNALVIGLKKVDAQTKLNNAFKAHLSLNDVVTKGSVTYRAEVVQRNSIEGIVNFDNLKKLETIDLFLNRLENWYGAYVNFHSLYQDLSDIEFKLNAAYEKYEDNIKVKMNKFREFIKDTGKKRYASIGQLGEKYPVLEKLAEYICEEKLGEIALDLDGFTKLSDADKNTTIKAIEEQMTKMNKTEAGDILSMGYGYNNRLQFDINLNKDKLNKLFNVNCFTSGTIKVTVSADDAKRIGSFSVEVKDLKTNAPLVLQHDEKTQHSKKITLNDVNFKVVASINYELGSSYAELSDEIDNITSGNFEPFIE